MKNSRINVKTFIDTEPKDFEYRLKQFLYEFKYMTRDVINIEIANSNYNNTAKTFIVSYRETLDTDLLNFRFNIYNKTKKLRDRYLSVFDDVCMVQENPEWYISHYRNIIDSVIDITDIDGKTFIKFIPKCPKYEVLYNYILECNKINTKVDLNDLEKYEDWREFYNLEFIPYFKKCLEYGLKLTIVMSVGDYISNIDNNDLKMLGESIRKDFKDSLNYLNFEKYSAKTLVLINSIEGKENNEND